MSDMELMAVGDLYVDLVVDLSEASPPVTFAELDSTSNCFGSWTRQAGGSALQVATAALATGFGRATCVGAVGGRADAPDDGASLLSEAAAAVGVELLSAHVPEAPTGEALVVYDPGGTRLMVSHRGANELLTTNHLSSGCIDAAGRADVVHISGYTLLQDDRWQAASRLADAARRGGGLVALDLVPHNIDRLVDPKSLLGTLEGEVDCLMVDRGLLGRVARAHEGGSPAGDPVSWALSRFEKLVLMELPDSAAIVEAGRTRRFPVLRRTGTASRGHSALVQTQALRMLLGG